LKNREFRYGTNLWGKAGTLGQGSGRRVFEFPYPVHS
jgi:hypothetical protein